MAITYKWIIESMECVLSENGMNNIVKTVNYQYIGSDGTNEYTVFGKVDLGDPDPNTYIQYSSLTENTVISWVSSKVGTYNVNHYENVISTAISNMINPPIVTNLPPWANT